MLNQVFSLRKFSFFFVFTAFLLILSSFSYPSGGLVNDVLSYTNQFRKSKGKHVLIMRDDLNAIARRHSENMAKGRVAFGHSGFDKRHAQAQRIFQSCTMAENVAYGVSTGKDVVQIWKKSSDHRSNMLGNYNYIGIGTAKDRSGRVYYTQIFIR